uniref:Uncharacterized protein n=1 Tax=Oryza brachyantha TaxID=4533 RepID=J3LVF1_ORYBR
MADVACTQLARSSIKSYEAEIAALKHQIEALQMKVQALENYRHAKHKEYAGLKPNSRSSKLSTTGVIDVKTLYIDHN